MDKKTLSEIEERLLDANRIVAKLDPSIRTAAFDFLKPYISTGKLDSAPDSHKPPAHEPPASDVAQLIETHGGGKPYENVNLLAAIWFIEYGSHPFSLGYIRERATSTGLTIPARPDMSLRQAKEKGRNCVQAFSPGAQAAAGSSPM